jgi:hypothetical protein
MYLLSNTQIYKNAGYIPSKIVVKAVKLLTQLSEKLKNKSRKFQFFKIPNSKTENYTKKNVFWKLQFLKLNSKFLKFQIPKL